MFLKFFKFFYACLPFHHSHPQNKKKQTKIIIIQKYFVSLRPVTLSKMIGQASLAGRGFFYTLISTFYIIFAPKNILYGKS